MTKLRRDLSTPSNVAFWKSVEDSAREVESWPAWKRAGINEAVTGQRSEPRTLEQEPPRPAPTSATEPITEAWEVLYEALKIKPEGERPVDTHAAEEAHFERISILRYKCAAEVLRRFWETK